MDAYDPFDFDDRAWPRIPLDQHDRGAVGGCAPGRLPAPGPDPGPSARDGGDGCAEPQITDANGSIQLADRMDL